MFQTASVIEKMTTRADKTVKLVVSTQELKPNEATELFKLINKPGYFLFKENAIMFEDIPLEDAKIDDNEKSVSQRLRSVLFVWHKQQTEKGKRTDTFNTFYREYMETKIDKIKETLE